MKNTFTFILFLISATITGCYGQQLSGKDAQIDALLKKAHSHQLFNGTAIVLENNKIIYRNAIGQADATGEIKLTTDYRFHIGSIAKEFNAVGIMMLKEQGKLSLDDKVSKYLPELPPWANDIKIINLLQYTSGVPMIDWKNTKDDADNMEHLKKVAKLDFEPGTQYNYNNNDVFLQRRIIERITKMPFSTFVYKKLLKPSGIKNGIVDPVATDSYIAKAFNNKSEEDKFEYNISGWTALTTDDFLKWSEAINSFKLISPESTRQLLTPFFPGKQTGLGGGTMDGNKITKHTHDGTANNYQALLISEPTYTIILQTNNKQNNLYPISNAIEAILQGKTYTDIKKSFIATFGEEFENMSGEQIIALYKKEKTANPDLYNFDEGALNDTGYFLLRRAKNADAITVFNYNVMLFPSSGNVYDSLGEAYYLDGNKTKAIESYTKALQFDPTLDSSKQMLEKLKQ